MTTKEQERKALDKIRKIVADLGDDSYVAWAFEGCFDIAEDNITNDFANSPRKSAEHLQKLHSSAVAKLAEKDAEIERLETTVQTAEDHIADLTHDRDYFKGLYDETGREYMMLFNSKEDLEGEIRELKGQIDSRDYEIMKLKARLFDLLDK